MIRALVSLTKDCWRGVTNAVGILRRLLPQRNSTGLRTDQSSSGECSHGRPILPRECAPCYAGTSIYLLLPSQTVVLPRHMAPPSPFPPSPHETPSSELPTVCCSTETISMSDNGDYHRFYIILINLRHRILVFAPHCAVLTLDTRRYLLSSTFPSCPS